MRIIFVTQMAELFQNLLRAKHLFLIQKKYFHEIYNDKFLFILFSSSLKLQNQKMKVLLTVSKLGTTHKTLKINQF